MKPLRLPPAVFVLVFNQFHIANVINTIGMTMYVVDRFEATNFQVGLLGLLQFTTYGSVAWAGGLLADRFAKRAMMTGGLIALSIGFWLVPLAPSLRMVYLLAAYCSVVQIAIFPANFSLIGEIAHPRRLSRLLGLSAFSLVFGGMIAAFMVGRLLESQGPMITFRACSAICLVIALFAATCAPRPDREAGVEIDPRGETLAEPPGALAPRRAFLIVALALNFTGFFFGITHQTFLVRLATLPEFDLSLGEQSNIQALRLLAAMGGYLFGIYTNRWHWRRWVLGAVLVWMAAVSLLGGLAPGPGVLTLAIFLGGFATSFANQISLYYAIGGGVVSQGRGAGLTESALALGAGLGPMFAGIAASIASTARAALFVPLGPIAVSLVLWAALMAPTKSGGADDSESGS